MGSSKKFWVGILLGAAAGGTAALFEKTTRQAVKEDLRKVSGTVSYVVKNPQEFIEDVREAAYKVRSTVEQVTEDVAFITQKVEEMRDVPPQVTEIVKGTKEALSRIAASEQKLVNNEEK